MDGPLKRGEFVRLTYFRQTVRATVLLASGNGRSLMLQFDGILWTPGNSVFAGMLPLLRDEDGVFRDLLTGEAATVERENSTNAPLRH